MAARVRSGRMAAVMEWGNRAEAGVRHGEAKPKEPTVRRGGGYGDGGVQPELAGGRHRAEQRGESEEECSGFGRNGGNERGCSGDRLYTLVEGESWPSGAATASEVARHRGIVGAKSAPVFGEKRGRRWRRGVASGPTRERARGGQEWRRRGRFLAAMVATAVADLRLGMIGGVHGSHLSAKEEREAGWGGKLDFWEERAEHGAGLRERERAREREGRAGRGEGFLGRK
uniref:Uncharacterized protein n=1 Tax=Oryza sativa subsp. japonica TaxID=39947 RepID=Q33AR8_ORYSJ|nr:hypothetical protein LOC_Os10g08500 [Oryza sativa Japonica Group]